MNVIELFNREKATPEISQKSKRENEVIKNPIDAANDECILKVETVDDVEKLSYRGALSCLKNDEEKLKRHPELFQALWKKISEESGLNREKL